MKTSRKPEWAKMLHELKAFQRSYGHIRVDEYGKHYPVLARWLRGIRGRLQTFTYAQILSLDNLGFFDQLDQRWLDRYAQLQAFRERVGHCKVPSTWPENPSLGIWVQHQRAYAAKMVRWRRKLLEDSGFCFRIVHTGISVEWDEVIGRIERYRKRFGNCNVPARWSGDKTLAHWVSHLRAIKKSLKPGIIKQLDLLGFDWNPRNTAWERGFRELEAFHKQHGHSRVPETSGALGIWVGNLRQKKDILSKKQLRRLKKIGFDWSPLKTRWNARYRELLAFRKRFGHANVPALWAENRDLATWVLEQRGKAKALSPERVALLEKAGFDWGRRETAWMRRYEELKAFHRNHGHFDPPVSGSVLGEWVHRQRAKAKKMPAHRRKLLDQIGFTWNGMIRNAWMRRYEELKAFHTKYGRSPFPSEPPLGRWVSTQRHFQAASRMPPDRKKLLDAIGFRWRLLARR